MVTYTQNKLAINYSYWKREVQSDGVSTKPLELVMCPWRREEGYHFNDHDVLSPFFPCLLFAEGIVFQNSM